MNKLEKSILQTTHKAINHNDLLITQNHKVINYKINIRSTKQINTRPQTGIKPKP
jgi:hypothetical protein